MSSPPSSPNGAQSDDDFDMINHKKTKKTKKKKTTTNATTTNNNDANANTNTQQQQQQSCPVSDRRMVLRDATQRRLPGRYREAGEIPDTRPAWVHPPVAFNADLARFVASYSLPLPMDRDDTNNNPSSSSSSFSSPPQTNGEGGLGLGLLSPSRERYHAWLEEEKKKKKRMMMMMEEDALLPLQVSAKIRPEVLNGTSRGPDVVHLPPLPEQSRRQREQQEWAFPEDEDDDGDKVGGAGAAGDAQQLSDHHNQAETGGDNETMSPNLKWQDLSKPTQWALIDYQTNKLRLCGYQGLPDAFHTLHLRLGEIIEFADMYNSEKNRYDRWRARIRARDPAANGLGFYYDRDVWTNMDLVAYFVSDKDVRQGQRYLRCIGESDVDDLTKSRGRRRQFFAIDGMDDLDVAFLKDAARRGVDTEYGDLTRESIDWLSSSSSSSSYNNNNLLAPKASPAMHHQHHQVKQFQPRTPRSLEQKVRKLPKVSNNNLDGAASDGDDDDNHHDDIAELTSPFDRNFPYIAHEPFYYSRYSEQAVARAAPVGRPPHERRRPVKPPGRPGDPAFLSDLGLHCFTRPARNDAADQTGPLLLDANLQGELRPLLHRQWQPYTQPCGNGPSNPQHRQEITADDGDFRSEILQAQSMSGHRYVGFESLPSHLGGPDHNIVGDSSPYQGGEGASSLNQPMDAEVPFNFNGVPMAPGEGTTYSTEAGYNPDPLQASQALFDAILNPENLAALEEEFGGPVGPHHQEMHSPQSGQEGFPLQDAPIIHDNQAGSIYQGLQDVTGFPPAFSGGSYEVAGVGRTSSACSYESRVRGLEEDLQNSTEANASAFHWANKQQILDPVGNFGSAYSTLHNGRSSLPPHLAFDKEWYAAQQPFVHSFPRHPIPGWGNQPMWDPMLAQDAEADENEGGVLASFVPGQTTPNALIDPRLLDVRTSQDLLGSVPVVGQKQPKLHRSQTAQANISNFPAAPVVGSTLNNALLPSPVPEAYGWTPTERQAFRANVTPAGTTPNRSSATNGAVRLSIVEMPSGQAVLQQEPVVENKASAPPCRVPKKRALDNFKKQDEAKPVVAAPARPRGHPHRKETISLESDEEFNGMGVPICESDDEDWVEPKMRKYTRKGKKSGEATKEKKPSQASRRKKPNKVAKGKKVSEAPKRKNDVGAPRPKYVRKKKAGANNSGAPAPAPAPAPKPVLAPTMPTALAVTGHPSIAPLPTLPWNHTSMPGFDPGLNNLNVSSGDLPPATAGRNAERILPTPPISNELPALVAPGFIGFDHQPEGVASAVTAGAASTTGEGQTIVSEPPNQKPKRKYIRRPKKDQEDEAATKPKRARTKKTDAANKKGTRVAPPAGLMETPVPLPPMPCLYPGQQGGSFGDENSASSYPVASSNFKTGPKASTQYPVAQQEGENSSELAQKGSYRNRISAEEFDAMTSRGEMLSFEQPQQTGGPAAEAVALAPPHSVEPRYVMVPALSGVPIVPQTFYPRPEPMSLTDAFTGVYASSPMMRPMAPATPSPEKHSTMQPTTQATPSPIKRSSTANDDTVGKNTVVRNIQKAQKKIKASVMTSQSVVPEAQPVARMTDYQPFIPQTESFFTPIQSNAGSPTQQQPTLTQEDPKPARKNSIDPKTGRPRVGRPRTRKSKEPSYKPSQEQPQTEQACIAKYNVVDQGVNIPANEPQ